MWTMATCIRVSCARPAVRHGPVIPADGDPGRLGP
jgi:hypothetical protein